MYGYDGMLWFVINSIIVVLILFVFTLILGNKQISQLTLFDFFIGISIGAIAVALILGVIPYSSGILSLIVLTAFPLLFSYLSSKNLKAREIIKGKSKVIVQNGKMLEQNMKKSRINMTDLLENLRIKGAFNVADVEFAILETNGEISVQYKSQKQPATPSDLNIPTQYKGLSANLILDGEIKYNNLKMVQLDETWLMNELKKQNILSPSEVLLASLDTTGRLHVDKKNNDPIPLGVIE